MTHATPGGHVVAEHLPERSAQRVWAVNREQRSLLGIKTTREEIRQQRCGDGRVLGGACPWPNVSLPPSVVIPAATMLIRPLISTQSRITTARHRSASSRDINLHGASLMRSTHARDTEDFDVERSLTAISSPR